MECSHRRYGVALFSYFSRFIFSSPTRNHLFEPTYLMAFIVLRNRQISVNFFDGELMPANARIKMKRRKSSEEIMAAGRIF